MAVHGLGERGELGADIGEVEGGSDGLFCGRHMVSLISIMKGSIRGLISLYGLRRFRIRGLSSTGGISMVSVGRKGKSLATRKAFKLVTDDIPGHR